MLNTIKIFKEFLKFQLYEHHLILCLILYIYQLMDRERIILGDFQDSKQIIRSLPLIQKQILQYWSQNSSFQKLVKMRQNQERFILLDGPPFTTGLPHLGHIAVTAIKDVFCRYSSQSKRRVVHNIGWDCHGIPIEHEINKDLGIRNKIQIFQHFGMQRYIQKCQQANKRYITEWQKVLSRSGRWVNYQKNYQTSDKQYMESVWLIFKELFDKGLVYKKKKVLPYSNSLQTPLSSFEQKLNYKQVSVQCVWITFSLLHQQNTKLVVYTDAAWKITSNLALVVNPQSTYVKVKDLERGQFLIFAQSQISKFYKNKGHLFQMIQKFRGHSLKDLQYKPPFNIQEDRRRNNGCFRVLLNQQQSHFSDSYILNCSPFDEKLFNICLKEGIISVDDIPVLFDDTGKFNNSIPLLQNIQIGEASSQIIGSLKSKDRVIFEQRQRVNQPHCWRSGSPLIFKPVQAWFLNVQLLKDKIKNDIKWSPKHIQKLTACWSRQYDWCLSRTRVWGTPIPIWVSHEGEQALCVGSFQELQKLTGHKIKDLHRGQIDKITIQSKKGKGKLKRIQQVFDCWFESGAMPYCQTDCSFLSMKQQLSNILPADLIVEGLDQTRGWFYTLNILSNALINKPAAKIIFANGLLLNNNDKWIRRRNPQYQDPINLFEQFGADIVRVYILSSALARGENINFSQNGLRDVSKEVFQPWASSWHFLIQVIKKYEEKFKNQFLFFSLNQETMAHFSILQKWALSRLNYLIKKIKKLMDQFNIYEAVSSLISFLQLVKFKFLKLNRKAYNIDNSEEDSCISIKILFHILLQTAILMAPYTPFFSQFQYLRMKCYLNDALFQEQSVHHLSFPTPILLTINQSINQSFEKGFEIIQTVKRLRSNQKISMRNRMKSLTILYSSIQQAQTELREVFCYIKDECNVEQLLFSEDFDKYVEYYCLPNLPILGPKMKGNKLFIQIRDEITKMSSEEVKTVQKEGIFEICGTLLSVEDIIILKRFKFEQLKQFQISGGEKITVLLDARTATNYDQKKLVDQIITAIQELKIKENVSQSQVFCFYKLDQEFAEVKELLQENSIQIKQRAKLQAFNFWGKGFDGFITIGMMEFKTLNKQIAIFLTYPHFICNDVKLKEDFGEKGKILKMCFLSYPYAKIKQMADFRVRVDGLEYLLVKGKHYYKI